MAAIIITVNYLPLHCTQSVTARWTKRGAITWVKRTVAVTAQVEYPNISFWFSQQGGTVVHCSNSISAFQSSFNVWECFEVQTLTATMRFGYLQFCNIKTYSSFDVQIRRGDHVHNIARKTSIMVWREKARNVFAVISQQIVWASNWITIEQFPRSTTRKTSSWKDLIQFGFDSRPLTLMEWRAKDGKHHCSPSNSVKLSIWPWTWRGYLLALHVILWKTEGGTGRTKERSSLQLLPSTKECGFTLTQPGETNTLKITISLLLQLTAQ